MVTARAVRAFRLARKSYAPDDPVELGDQQFRDLEMAGLVVRVAAPPVPVARRLANLRRRHPATEPTEIADPGNNPPETGINHGAE